jgi:hypothetical protein
MNKFSYRLCYMLHVIEKVRELMSVSNVGYTDRRQTSELPKLETGRSA